ncbi:MAG: hypothetical protein ACXACR_16670 [Candidatus Hodarchaeales archaeon]
MSGFARSELPAPIASLLVLRIRKKGEGYEGHCFLPETDMRYLTSVTLV